MAHDDQTFPRNSGVSAFGTLALDVVSQLSARHTGAQANQTVPFAAMQLERALVSRNSFDPSDALDELRALRLSDDAIIDHCIPDTARVIGHRWVNNELGFAEVTIAAARLQSLLTEVEFLNPDTQPVIDCPYDILIAACEHEQHTLGCFVTAAQLRRRGALVETMCGESDALIKARILSNGYDAILFSCSRRQDLETISQIVIDSRMRMSNPPVFALGGIVLDTIKSIKRLTGVDVATSDVDRVVDYCEQRSTRPLKQATR